MELSTTTEKYLQRLKSIDDSLESTEKISTSIWYDFLSLWSQILHDDLSEIPLSSKESLRLVPRLIDKIGFVRIRKDISIVQHICFHCLDELNEQRIRTYLTLSKDEQHLPEHVISYKHVYYLLFLSARTISFLPFHSSEQQQFLADHLDLFELLINRVDQRMPQQVDCTAYSIGAIGERILTLLWNLTDRLIIVPILLRSSLVEKVLQWLTQASLLTDKSRRPLISIIQNLARHDQAVPQFNQFDAIPIIRDYRSKSLEKSACRKLLISMSLASLSTPEQLKENAKGMNALLDQLLQLTKDSFHGDRCRFDGIHLSEPLQILVKLFVVEERTLDYILSHAETNPPSTHSSTVQLFLQIFLQFNQAFQQNDRLEQFTLTAITNLLWSVSFLNQCKDELRQDQSFIQAIRQLSEHLNEEDILQQYQPKSMENIQQAAKGILHNLHLLPEQNLPLVDPSTSTSSTSNWIMISYSHDNVHVCEELHRYLASSLKDVNIWLDRTHINGAGDLWESIAQGIEQSQVICCLLSPQYLQSKSCRQEFIYANDSVKKIILPILINDFQPKGWLGIRMTGVKYIRFRDEYQLEEKKKKELLATILTCLSARPIQPADMIKTAVDEHTVHSSTSVSHNAETSSNTNEIETWFQAQHLSKAFSHLFDFQSREEMIEYAQLLLKDPEKQMNTYSKIYSQKYSGKEMPPHEFVRFTRSLQQLVAEDSTSLVSNASRSRTCLLM